MLQWIPHNLKQAKTAAVVAGTFFVLLFFFSLILPQVTRAQSQGAPNSEVNVGLQGIREPLGAAAVDVRIIVARIIRIALGLLGLVFLVLVLYGGFLWMTAGGNEERIAEAKKLFFNAVIGLVIILAAYSIVLFVMRLLGLGSTSQGGQANAPNSQNFVGSGALGKIIKDHYPGRGQTDVARNTKIVITFFKPIKLDSFVEEKSGDELFGNCRNIGAGMSWENDCDALKNIDDDHLNITRADTGEKIRGAAFLAAYENGKVFTIVIRPYDYLGSSSTPVNYVVRLGKEIHLDDPDNNNPSAFNTGVVGNNYYAWQFTTGLNIDVTPPVVYNIFPDNGVKEAKNSVIQITFSEAVDPIGLQGVFNTTTDNGVEYFSLDGNNIFLTSANSSRPSGVFQLTNGYRTLEFTPDQECGTNACGGKIYCLPVCDKPNNKCGEDSNKVKEDDYELLLKAGLPFSASAFEAIPFSGVMDMAGNALDGGGAVAKPASKGDGKVEYATTTLPVFPNWKEPDNYFWGFTLKDEIDLTTPYLQQIIPGLDAEYISANNLWQMTFSKRMRVDPMYTIGLEEYPASINGIPLCKVPRLFFNLNGTTDTRMDHCPFLDAVRQYYIPVVTSSVEDVHFNCFYPGKGPGGNAGLGGKGANCWSPQGCDHLGQSLICDESHPQNCCAVTSTPVSQALCCNGLVDNAGSVSTTPLCTQAIKNDSPL